MGIFGRESPQEQERIEAWGYWVRRRNPYAIASAVLGIISLIEFGVLLVFGIAGTVLGVVALKQLRGETTGNASEPERQSPQVESEREPVDYARRGAVPPIRASDYERFDPPVPRDRGHGLAWTGIITSIASLIAATVLYSLPAPGS